MNQKITLSIFVIGFLVSSFIFNIDTNNSSYALKEDRYSTECGIYLGGTPEEYLTAVGETWNYNVSAMPPYLANQYTCIERVYNESTNSFLNDIQSRADQRLSDLAEGITRGGSD